MSPPEGPLDSEPWTGNVRWSRSEESDDFFCDSDRLRLAFCLLAGGAACLLALLAAGLWRLQAAALAPPILVGIARGHIFSGPPAPLSSIRDEDFDPQLSDTVEVLFGRTEKGQPPELADYCTPEVLAAAARDYQDAAHKYPAGYVQTLAIVESRVLATRQGYRRMLYRGLLSSRSLSAAQSSPVYLEATFVIGAPTAVNSTGWRLIRLEALGRDDFYRQDREKAARQALDLPPTQGAR